MSEASKQEESVNALTLIAQYIIAREQDGSSHVERKIPTEDLMNPILWAKAKEDCAAKGLHFIVTVHAFRNKETGEPSEVANMDAATPNESEERLMREALLTARYADLFLHNLQESKAGDVLSLYSLECKDCEAGRALGRGTEA